MKKRISMILIFGFLPVLVLSLSLGRYTIDLMDVGRIVLSSLGITGFYTLPSPELHMIFWNIRVPRVILAFAVGSGLSIAGTVFQAMFKNPLAAPDILGVTAGSCFGAALAIMFFAATAWAVQANAFFWGVLAVSMAYLLASKSRDRSSSVLIIAGIAVSSVFQAGLSILMYVANPYDQMSKIIFWIMGSFHTASWSKVEVTLPFVLLGSLLLTIFSWRLNVMTQDEEDALCLGMNVSRWRIFYITTSTLMVASSVAAVGNVAWIGLIIPHIARYLVGSEHRRLVPVSGIVGGIFLLLMDTLARTLLLSEIPISIVTSIFGAPFLGYLVMGRQGVGIGIKSYN
jgi:iron complex transport system permease protein